MKREERMELIKFTIEELEKYPQRIGAEIYYQVRREKKYEMLGIDSDSLFNFMNYKMFVENDIELSAKIWRSAVSKIKGKNGDCDLKELRNRVARIDDNIYYDLQNVDLGEFKYVKINENGWEIVSECDAPFSWNQFSLSQTIPEKDKGDFFQINDFINLNKKDRLLYYVYVISLFLPDIQYPILNVNGEHSTGKTTISWIAKILSDPSVDSQTNYRNNEEDFMLDISTNHTTVYDNTELLDKKMNALFCQAVTGGQVTRRKLYSNTERVVIPLRSAIIINGISSVIKREDLMSRAIFVKTRNNERFKTSRFKSDSQLRYEFEKRKGIILGGIFDILSKAIAIKPSVQINKFYRLMDFAEWGYAIAEAIESGLGEKFLEVLDANEKVQLQETYDSEPLIMLVCNYMQVYGGDGICVTTQKFYNDLSMFKNQQYGIESRIFPKTLATFSKKIKSYISIFKKLGYEIDIYQSRDREHISKISITPIIQKDIQDSMEDVVERIPVIGIRKPIIGIRIPIMGSDVCDVV